MLSVLFCLATSIAKPGHVHDITIYNWEELIEKRDPNSVWVLFMYKDNFQPCTVLYPTILKASASADGLVHFGKVNEGTDNPIFSRLGVKMIPSIVVIHKSGVTEYKGKKREKDLTDPIVSVNYCYDNAM